MSRSIAQILVVEDDPASLEMEVLMLQQAGIDAVGVTSGTEALQVLETDGEIEAVLMDLSLPVLDGLTVTDEIRANERLHPDKRPVRIAYLTAQEIDAPIETVAERNNVERIFRKGTSDIKFLPERVRDWLHGGQ